MKGKFSAKEVLGSGSTKPEGLLVSKETAQKAPGGRPPIKAEKRRKARKFYLSEGEWKEFIEWCGDADVSNVIRMMIKRAMRTQKDFGGFFG